MTSPAQSRAAAIRQLIAKPTTALFVGPKGAGKTKAAQDDRIETYGGIAILATNQRQALDPAFLRRIRTVIDFPPPGADA